VSKRLKIAVYAISKNEASFVKRFCESAKDADLILIADTGSTDDTTVIAAECGAIVHDICITPWRFDTARNAALALVPRDIDICISLDLDEVLEPGWREEVERLWVNGVTRLRYPFDWGSGIKFLSEKIHARHGYLWHHPCHEYPVPDGRITEVWGQSDKLLVTHHPDPDKSRGQYLDLLALSVKEDPNCPRNAFYYARELTFYQKWHEAIAALNKYLAMPQATWRDDRCYAMRLLGKCYAALGDQQQAEAHLLRACAESSGTREPWCELAMLYYQQSRWTECYSTAIRALSITERALIYTAEPAAWGSWPHDLAAISAYRLGLKDAAIEHGRLAVEHSPDDVRLAENLKWYMGAHNGD
jgi:tetratricopeptide (TPR) repeat protein